MVIETPDTPVVTVTPDIEKVISAWAEWNRNTLLRSENGTPLGQYIPFPREPFCPWDPSLTEAELDRRARESKRHKLQDVWKRLGAK